MKYGPHSNQTSNEWHGGRLVSDGYGVIYYTYNFLKNDMNVHPERLECQPMTPLPRSDNWKCSKFQEVACCIPPTLQTESVSDQICIIPCLRIFVAINFVT